MASTNIVDILDFLLEEAGYSLGHHHHHHGHGHNDHDHHHPPHNGNKRAILQMDSWSRLVLLDQLLCMRAAEPELPPDIAEPADRILRDRLARRLATSSRSITPRFLVNPNSVPPSPSPSFSSSSSKRRGRPSLSIWKGDITTLADTTAIVNAANAQLLGCFQPRHPCIDNAIHAAAGPGLRRACWELMAAQGTEEPVGTAKVTPGFNLHARYVIHTVGPQLLRRRRGGGQVEIEEEQQPSDEDRRLLASCYEACLDAAEDLEPFPDGRKVLVFCGVSTGMFGFPVDEGCRVAVDAVLRWLGMHPETTLTDVIFNVFTEADLNTYQSRFSQLLKDRILLNSNNSNGNDKDTPSPSTSIPPPMPPLLAQQTALIFRARDWLATSSRLIISAGAGLSASTGLDYTSSALFTKHHHGFKKYGLSSLYSVFGFDEWPSDAARWSYNMHHLEVVRRWPRSKLYDDLLSFTRRRFESGDDDGGKDGEDGVDGGGGEGKEKKWFVKTSNADGFFAKHGFDTARICTPQGQYAFMQCATPCREDAVWPSEPFIDDAVKHVDPVTQHLPDDYEVPTCKFCGADLTLCVRGGDYFIEAPFEEMNGRYAGFVKECLAEVVETADGRGGSEKWGAGEDAVTTTILELGVGMNTPSVLRWHNEHLVQRAKGKFRLVRLGLDAAGCVDPALEESGLAVGLYGDIARLFEVLDIK